MRPDRQRHNPARSWNSGWLLLACLALAGCVNLGPSEHPVVRADAPLKDGVYALDKVDVRPVTTQEVQAKFPSGLGGYLTGKATVAFTVGVDGKPADAIVVMADNGEFGEGALRAISKWRFLPAQVKSRPVPCRMSVPFFFDSPYEADTDLYDVAAPPDKGPSGPPSGSISPQ